VTDVSTTAYTRVCALEDLIPDIPAAADVDGVIVALVRTVTDRGDIVYAVNDRCTHANVSLSEGEVDGCTIECWLHGSRFDLRTGEPTGPPATVPVATYPVKIESGDVFVSVNQEN
jgi:3-phenylpropionate/trans-cinnamate dioxygenase ferredoxin subunit